MNSWIRVNPITPFMIPTDIDNPVNSMMVACLETMIAQIDSDNSTGVKNKATNL